MINICKVADTVKYTCIISSLNTVFQVLYRYRTFIYRNSDYSYHIFHCIDHHVTVSITQSLLSNTCDLYVFELRVTER